MTSSNTYCASPPAATEHPASRTCGIIISSAFAALPPMRVLRKPYLLYLGDAVLKSDCKTAFGLRDWCPADVLGEWSHPDSRVSLGLPRLSPRQAAAKGAGSIVIGVAPTGGQLPDHWHDDLEAALEAGLDVVSGLHTRLGSFPRLCAAAQRRGVQLIDVRHPVRDFPVASGRKRSG